MSIKQTGNFEAVVTSVDFIEHRFQAENPDQLEIKIGFKTDDGSDFIYMDLSAMKYVPKGKYQGMKSCEATNATLNHFGIDLNKDPKGIMVLINKEIKVYGQQSQKTGDYYYSLSVREDKKVKGKDLLDKLSSIFSAETSTETAPVSEISKETFDDEVDKMSPF